MFLRYYTDACAQAHVLRAYRNFLFHLFLKEMEESKMIRNGRPYTNENGWEDAGLITDHPQEEQDIVLEWIRRNILPRKTVLHGRTSYGMKHILEHDTKIYLTNNEFKDAMMICGFEPADPNMLNWIYRISAKSPAFKR